MDNTARFARGVATEFKSLGAPATYKVYSIMKRVSVVTLLVTLSSPLLAPAPIAADAVQTSCEIPLALSAVAPSYPEIWRKARIQEEVVVRVEVGTDGRVQAAEIPNSSRFVRQFGVGEYFIAAAREWLFEPPVKENACRTIELSFTFELIDSNTPRGTPLTRFEPPGAVRIQERYPKVVSYSIGP